MGKKFIFLMGNNGIADFPTALRHMINITPTRHPNTNFAFCQGYWVMCTHIWRFSRVTVILDKYVRKYGKNN
jgi:hypothetical protein